MDAAMAAAMSNPERNRRFRRRWLEVNTPNCEQTIVEPQDDCLELTGLAMLAAWRSTRGKATVRKQSHIGDLSNHGSPLVGARQ